MKPPLARASRALEPLARGVVGILLVLAIRDPRVAAQQQRQRNDAEKNRSRAFDRAADHL